MSNYIRYGIIPFDEVIKVLRSKKKGKHTFSNGITTNISSLRLKTFARDAQKLYCVNCGLKATLFAAESHPNSNVQLPHLNLYAEHDGVETLMTHDHIIARALGGSDTLSNTQVMCSPCNRKKGVREGKIAMLNSKQDINKKV